MAKPLKEISLRIVVVQPTPGVIFALQRGKSDLTKPTMATKGDLTFDLTVRVGGEGEESPNLLGPYVQGRKGERFIYVNSGTSAGQTDSCWSRRAKVVLRGITWDQLEQLAPSQTGRS